MTQYLFITALQFATKHFRGKEKKRTLAHLFFLQTIKCAMIFNFAIVVVSFPRFFVSASARESMSSIAAAAAAVGCCCCCLPRSHRFLIFFVAGKGLPWGRSGFVRILWRKKKRKIQVAVFSLNKEGLLPHGAPFFSLCAGLETFSFHSNKRRVEHIAR